MCVQELHLGALEIQGKMQIAMGVTDTFWWGGVEQPFLEVLMHQLGGLCGSRSELCGWVHCC